MFRKILRRGRRKPYKREIEKSPINDLYSISQGLLDFAREFEDRKATESCDNNVFPSYLDLLDEAYNRTRWKK